MCDAYLSLTSAMLSFPCLGKMILSGREVTVEENGSVTAASRWYEPSPPPPPPPSPSTYNLSESPYLQGKFTLSKTYQAELYKGGGGAFSEFPVSTVLSLQLCLL